MRYQRIRGFFCAALICISFTTWAKPLPIELYGDLPHTQMVRLSPDGSKVAYLSNEGDNQQIVVFDRHTKKTIGGLDVSSVRPFSIKFINNDQILVFAYQFILKKYYGDIRKQRISTVFRYNISDHKTAQLLKPGRGISTYQTGMGEIAGISADGDYLFMPAYVPFKGTYDGDATYDLLKVSLNSKKPMPRPYKKGSPDTLQYFVAPTGEVLARELYDNRENLHRIESLLDGDWVEIFREKTAYPTKGAVGVSPDLKSLIFADENSNGMDSFYLMSLKSGKLSESVFSREDREVSNWYKDLNQIVYGVSYSGFQPTYEFFDRKLTAKVKAVQKAFGNDSVTLVDRSDDWNTLLFKVEGDGIPGDYFIFEKGELSFLTGSVDDVLVEHTNPVKEYQYKARDGLTIPTLLTYPKGKPAKNLPAIMLPHGGPESYDRKGFDWLAQYFASRGYLVIQPQFRGSYGFGAAHTLAGRGEWGKKMQDDLTDALHALDNEGQLDPNRVCIVGGSYGGYAALAGSTFTPDLYRCAISINGVSDLDQMLSTAKRKYGSRHWVVSYWEDAMADGELGNDYLESVSPVNFAEKVRAPILLIHGSQDDVVPMEQSEDMYDELKDADKEVIFVELEGDDHYLSKGKSRIQALKAIDKFIQKHLG